MGIENERERTSSIIQIEGVRKEKERLTADRQLEDDG